MLQNLKSVHNAFCNPFADGDISTRSSYRMQFTVEPFGSNMGSVSCLLKRNGLNLTDSDRDQISLVLHHFRNQRKRSFDDQI